MYYISSSIINNEDQSYSGHTEADGKSQCLPQGGACQHKKHKNRKDRERTGNDLMHFCSLAVCTVYLSVLLPLLKSHLPDPWKWWDARTKHVFPRLRLYSEDSGGCLLQAPEALTSFESYLPIKQGSYGLRVCINSCAWKSFLSISSGLWRAHNEKLAPKLEASKTHKTTHTSAVK